MHFPKKIHALLAIGCLLQFVVGCVYHSPEVEKSDGTVAIYRKSKNVLGVKFAKDILGDNLNDCLINIVFETQHGAKYLPVEWRASFSWNGSSDFTKTKDGRELLLLDVGEFDRVAVMLRRNGDVVYDSVFDNRLTLIENEKSGYLDIANTQGARVTEHQETKR